MNSELESRHPDASLFISDRFISDRFISDRHDFAAHADEVRKQAQQVRLRRDANRSDVLMPSSGVRKSGGRIGGYFS